MGKNAKKRVAKPDKSVPLPPGMENLKAFAEPVQLKTGETAGCMAAYPTPPQKTEREKLATSLDDVVAHIKHVEREQEYHKEVQHRLDLQLVELQAEARLLRFKIAQ